jgi:hypothetical protein
MTFSRMWTSVQPLAVIRICQRSVPLAALVAGLACLVVGERHPVRLPRVALDFGDEPVLVLGTGLEPAIAIELKHLVHDSSRRG